MLAATQKAAAAPAGTEPEPAELAKARAEVIEKIRASMRAAGCGR
jgi:hypothetical protein